MLATSSGSAGDYTLVSVGNLFRLPILLHRRPQPLVHRRGPATALGRVRAAAHQGSVTPSLTTGDVVVSLASYGLVYAFIYSFGVHYIYKLLRQGPTGEAKAIPAATASRPMAYADLARPRPAA